MNRHVHIIILAAFYLLMLGAFAACSLEEIQEKPTPQPPRPVENSPINVSLTRSGSEGVDISAVEDSVARARMIIVSSSGKVLVNDYKPSTVLDTLPRTYISTPTPKTVIHIVFKEDSVPIGTASFFTVTNEKPEWLLGNYLVGDQVNVYDLKEKILGFTSASYPLVDLGNPIPMAGIYENVYINSDSTVYKNLYLTDTVYPGDVNRLYAKVTVQLNCNFLDLVPYNGGAPIEVLSVSIKSMPKRSYLAPIPYILPDTVNGALYTYSNGVPQPPRTFNYVTKNSGGFQTTPITFYVPEYLISDTAKYTYIHVLANLVGNPLAIVPYRIVVGDGIDPDRNGVSGHNNAWLLDPNSPGRWLKDLTIQRNTHYHFIANIQGFNISGDQLIEIHPRVLHWDDVNDLDSIDIVDYQLTLSQDVFKTTASTYSGVVNITTDYSKGWRVIAATATSPSTVAVTPAVGTYVASGKLSFEYAGSLSAYITIATGPGDKIKKNIYINTSGLPGSGDD